MNMAAFKAVFNATLKYSNMRNLFFSFNLNKNVMKSLLLMGVFILSTLSLWSQVNLSSGAHLSDAQLRLRDSADPNHYLKWNSTTDGPELAGNQGGRLGTTSGGFQEVLRWKKNGHVGIGTNNPLDLLQVGDQITKISFGSAYGGSSTNWGTSYIGFNIARTSSNNWFADTDGANNGAAMVYSDVIGTLRFVNFPSTGNSDANYDANNMKNHQTMMITGQGKVGIGLQWLPNTDLNTQGEEFRLYVKGGIKTEEVKVELCTGSWCDYVFEEDYDLKSLAEVEQYIEENGHLHNTASAATLEKEGLELKAITINQQEKIEEVFLHLIALEKRVLELEKENKQLKAANLSTTHLGKGQ